MKLIKPFFCALVLASSSGVIYSANSEMADVSGSVNTNNNQTVDAQGNLIQGPQVEHGFTNQSHNQGIVNVVHPPEEETDE
jgi:hypothetical protein